MAALLSRAVTVHRLGYAVIDPDAFATASEETALRALGRVLACIGGAVHTPRLESVEEALARLGTGDITVAGCRVVRRRGAWLVCREAGRVAPPVPLAEGAWDGRWRWSPTERRGDGPTLGAIGKAGAAVLPKEVRRAHPAVVVAALPALFQGERVVAVPGLGWWSPALTEDVQPLCKSLRFAPRVAMTYVQRCGLRRGRRHLCRQVDVFRVAEGRIRQ